MVSVGCAALAALVPACGSSDSGGGGTAGGNSTAGAGGGSSAGASAGGGSSMNTAKTGNATTGATLYTKMTMPGSCDSCHGPDTGGGIGPNISGSTPAGLGGWTEEQFYQVIRNGKTLAGGKVCMEMPQFKTTDLSDQDIADIFAFTQSKMVPGAQQGSWVTVDPTCTAK